MFIKNWLISALVIILAAYIIPGVDVTLIGSLVLAVVLGIINAFIKPIIILLTLPVTIITLGLFALVINAGLVMLAAAIVPGFDVSGFFTALIFSIIVSLISAFFANIKDN